MNTACVAWKPSKCMIALAEEVGHVWSFEPKKLTSKESISMKENVATYRYEQR